MKIENQESVYLWRRMLPDATLGKFDDIINEVINEYETNMVEFNPEEFCVEVAKVYTELYIGKTVQLAGDPFFDSDTDLSIRIECFLKAVNLVKFRRCFIDGQ